MATPHIKVRIRVVESIIGVSTVFLAIFYIKYKDNSGGKQKIQKINKKGWLGSSF